MQSPEYPDLWWGGPPRRFTEGRDRPVQYVVIHTTQGSEGITSAEAGAAYDRRRTDGVSTHYFHDQDTTVQEVLTSDRAHHARYHGNQIGVGHELCGLAQQTDIQWHDPASLGTLRNAARQVARDCLKYNLPVRRLSVAEVRAAYYAPESPLRPRGICGHGDVTAAYPEDGGTHWDPGPTFPWAEFLDMVRATMIGDDMGVPEDTWAVDITNDTNDRLAGRALWVARQNALAANQRLAGDAPIPAMIELSAKVDALTVKVDQVLAAIQSGVPAVIDASLLTVTSTITTPD